MLALIYTEKETNKRETHFQNLSLVWEIILEGGLTTS